MPVVCLNIFRLSLAISLSLVVDILAYVGVKASTQAFIIESGLQEREIITPVADLSSIQSSDRIFQAWQSLLQRYGCSAGDINQNKQILFSRYEFATNLDICLAQVSQLIVATPDLVKQEDLITLKKLQVEFSAELAAIRGRLDIETQITKLNSPITKLTGEIAVGISAANGGNKADDDEPLDSNLSLGSRVRLTFDTSFTGEDRLRVRLQSTNTPRFSNATGTNMARLSFQGDDEYQLQLSVLEYRLPITEQATVYIELEGGGLDDFANTLNPLLSGSSRGAISRFSQRNPIYRQSGGAGFGINYDFGDSVSLSLGYLGFDTPTDEADDIEASNNGVPYGAIAQLTLQPTESIGLGLTYVRSYNNLDTGTGSELANDPFDEQSNRIIANSYGLQLTWQLNSALTLGGWAGYTKATAVDLLGKPEASIFNYALTLAFPDLGKDGNLAGIAIGQPPKTTSNDLSTALQDKDTSIHLEAFYRFQATDNISVTPGLLVIVNPEHNKNNDTIYIGTVRTTFSF
ncbi:iron uptake porin [Synechocystis sp. PCC 7509]|uniref:iron uptake porin n=1 Tax=Synechocystis sp. PCC 7509 TaxID=927677 RepID=UPI0002AD101C|nr:iron uptake porin [Synechocystis sp. PCC 7509]